MNSNTQIIISSICSAFFGGIAVAMINYFANRKKNEAEIKKLEAETEKLRSDTSQVSENVKNIEIVQDDQKDQIKDIQQFLVRHLLTDHERNHLQKLFEKSNWPFQKDETTKFFYVELRNLRSIGLIEGFPNKGIRSLEREGGDVNSHFKISDEGIKYLKIYQKSNESHLEI
ncbi:MAG: hypothetical protein GY799_02245 [Desulfobulbaceae bacterium]|nr:hypothetical protein [Desulfobulbaceae bacterium]